MSQLTALQSGTIGAVLSLPVETPGGVGVDLTDATEVILYWLDSTGAVTERTPTVSDPAARGIVAYTTVAGDFETAGLYQCQVYAATPTWTGFSTVWTQPILENITAFPEDEPEP